MIAASDTGVRISICLPPFGTRYLARRMRISHP
jgi:hypothetical protein